MAIDLYNPFTTAESKKVGKIATAVVAATYIDLENADGETVPITGTTTIAGIGLLPGHKRTLVFGSALTLTYGAATIITPNAADLVVAAGDRVTIIGEDGPQVRVIGNVVRAAASAAVLAALSTLLASDSGKTYFLNSATEFVTTLPLPALGLRFTFIVSAAPSGASYTVVTSASANIMKGQVYSLDVNSATDPDFETSGGDTYSFVDGKAVAGDSAEFYCDGTNWFVRGFCSVFDAATITTAS